MTQASAAVVERSEVALAAWQAWLRAGRGAAPLAGARGVIRLAQPASYGRGLLRGPDKINNASRS